MTILLGLVLMPVLFRTLPKDELGVWLLLGQSWATLGILDLGFGVTLTRRIAFAKGRSGSNPDVPLTDATLFEIADLVATGVRIYQALAVLAFAVAFGLGFIYLRTLTLDAITLSAVWTAWGVLCLSQALTVWATPWTCLLQGVGHVGWDAIIASFVGGLTLVAQILAALCGGGLVSLAVVAAAGALLQRIVILRFAHRKRPELFQLHGQWRSRAFKEMSPLAIKAWATSLGILLVLNTDHFFVAKLAGTANLPAYRAGYIILLNINMLAVTVAVASSAFIAHLWKAGEIDQVQKLVVRNLRLGMFVMGGGGACVIGLGPVFFNLWLGPGYFIGYPILCTFFVLLLLEAQCYILTTASRATEDEVFAYWAIAAGLLKLALSWWLGHAMGIWGIATATLIAQLLTNHWFMVFRGLTRLKIHFWFHVKEVLLPMLLLLSGTFALVWLIRHILSDANSGWTVLSGTATASLLLFGALWWKVLDTSQRRSLTAALSSRFSRIQIAR